ncbi:cuticle protein AM1199-like [Macrobrachium rosenbergii]|uniref:cuticle protein AM1199-like n=1 Tax=Macrobrachium rosenbergii TaxID=79674 RepID=UPI0034D4E72F
MTATTVPSLHSFETENGISINVSNRLPISGQSNMEGACYFSPTGHPSKSASSLTRTHAGRRFPSHPTPTPLPAHAVEQIRIAEDQRRRASPSTN